jgi:3'-5' exoribonuclease
MEFGSPKNPMTMEALCLHGLDDLDAKLWGVHDFLKKEAAPGKRWTTFHRVHQRYFRIPESFPGEQPAPEVFREDPDEGPQDLFALDNTEEQEKKSY